MDEVEFLSGEMRLQASRSTGSINYSFFSDDADECLDAELPLLSRVQTAGSSLTISSCVDASNSSSILEGKSAFFEFHEEISSLNDESFELSPSVNRALNLDEAGACSEAAASAAAARALQERNANATASSQRNRLLLLSSPSSSASVSFSSSTSKRPPPLNLMEEEEVLRVQKQEEEEEGAYRSGCCGGRLLFGPSDPGESLPFLSVAPMLRFPEENAADEDLPSHFDRLKITEQQPTPLYRMLPPSPSTARDGPTSSSLLSADGPRKSSHRTLETRAPSQEMRKKKLCMIIPQSCRSARCPELYCAVPVFSPRMAPCTPMTPCGNDKYIHLLPTVPAEDDQCPVQYISPEVLSEVVLGKFDGHFIQRFIFDCRFEYEYEVGHVKGAVNIPSFDHLTNFLSTEPRLAYEECPLLVVLYCEFSKERSVRIATAIRRFDRMSHINSYPELKYKEIYIVRGGYRRIHEDCMEICDPNDYRPMDAAGFSRSKSANWKRFVDSVGRE